MATNAQIAQLLIELKDEVSGKLEKVDKSFNSFQSNVKKGAKIIASSFAVISGAAAVAVKDYADFETKIRDVGNLIDATTKQSEMMQREIIALSSEVNKNAHDLAASMFDVVSAGVESSEAMDVLRVSAKLATAGVTDTKTAVNAVTTALNAWTLEASEAEKVSDSFFAGQVKGKTTIAELSDAIGRVAPTAAAMDLSLDETLATISALTTKGIATSEAVTGMKAALSAIIKPSKEAAELATDLNVEFDAQALKAKGLTQFLKDVAEATDNDAAAMGKLFGSVEALNAVLALANDDFKTLDETLKFVEASIGSTDKAFDAQMNTIAKKGEQIKNDVLAASKLVVLEFNDEIQTALDLIGDLSGRLVEKLSDGHIIKEWKKTLVDIEAATKKSSAQIKSLLTQPFEAETYTTLIDKLKGAVNGYYEALKESAAGQTAINKKELDTQANDQLNLEEKLLKIQEEADEKKRLIDEEYEESQEEKRREEERAEYEKQLALGMSHNDHIQAWINREDDAKEHVERNQQDLLKAYENWLDTESSLREVSHEDKIDKLDELLDTETEVTDQAIELNDKLLEEKKKLREESEKSAESAAGGWIAIAMAIKQAIEKNADYIDQIIFGGSLEGEKDAAILKNKRELRDIQRDLQRGLIDEEKAAQKTLEVNEDLLDVLEDLREEAIAASRVKVGDLFDTGKAAARISDAETTWSQLNWHIERLRPRIAESEQAFTQTTTERAKAEEEAARQKESARAEEEARRESEREATQAAREAEKRKSQSARNQASIDGYRNDYAQDIEDINIDYTRDIEDLNRRGYDEEKHAAALATLNINKQRAIEDAERNYRRRVTEVDPDFIFHSGGRVGGYPGQESMGLLMSRERVLTEATDSQLVVTLAQIEQTMRKLEAAIVGGSGSSGGGDIVVQIDGREIYRAMKVAEHQDKAGML